MRLHVIAAALAATAAAVVPAAGTAHAAAQPASCSTIDIGDPGQMWISNQYVGEVEQQYDSCTHLVIAHWQWAGSWQQAHNGSTSVTVYVQASQAAGFKQSTPTTRPDTQKDVSSAIDVHAATPDQWLAEAVVNYCGTHGTLHDYSNGGTLDGPHPTHC
ncbi:hypothetical protein ACFW17_28745 [Streptomyces sp. NPDC058961]|uniref:hypothetical protein n=1 Tax=Streptomyces sp. NPDC058961 TaxID=3346680 RepID=UPI0036B82843